MSFNLCSKFGVTRICAFIVSYLNVMSCMVFIANLCVSPVAWGGGRVQCFSFLGSSKDILSGKFEEEEKHCSYPSRFYSLIGVMKLSYMKQ